jgi:hypothetical protein
MRPSQRSSATTVRCSHLSQRLLDGCLATAVPVPVLPRHDLVRPRLSSSQGDLYGPWMLMRFAVPIKYKWKTFVPVQLRQSTAVPPRGTATSPRPGPRQTTASNPPYPTRPARPARPARSPPLVSSAAFTYVDRTPSNYPDDFPSAIPPLPTPSRPIYAPYPTAQLYPVTFPPSPLPYTFPPAHSRRQTVPQSVELGYPIMGATSAFEQLLLARPGFSNPSLESAIYAPLRFEASRTPARVAKQDLVPAGQGFYGGWLDAGAVETGITDTELYPDRGYVYL